MKLGFFVYVSHIGLQILSIIFYDFHHKNMEVACHHEYVEEWNTIVKERRWDDRT